MQNNEQFRKKKIKFDPSTEKDENELSKFITINNLYGDNFNYSNSSESEKFLRFFLRAQNNIKRVFYFFS